MKRYPAAVAINTLVLLYFCVSGCDSKSAATGGNDAATGSGGSVSGVAGAGTGGAAGNGTGGDVGTGTGGATGSGSGGDIGAGTGGAVGNSTGGNVGAGTGGSIGTGGAGGTPATCNDVVNTAPVLTTKISHPEAPPAMTGGTIVDGTYFLTSMDKFNGTQGSSEKQETWVFAGGTLKIATDKLHASGTFTTSGNTVTVMLTCIRFDKSGLDGGAMEMVGTYTASATAVQKINTADLNEMHTFTKQ